MGTSVAIQISPETRAQQDAAFARTHARLRDLQEMTPGPTLLTALIAVRSQPIDAAGSLILAVLWDRQRAWTDAQLMIEVANAHDGAGQLPCLQPHEITQIVTAELAGLLHIAHGTASNLVALTQRVSNDLPLSWEALNRGEWTLNHIKALDRATDHCQPWLTHAIDTAIVPLAVQRGWTPGTIAAEARKIMIRLDPDGAADRAATKKQTADVEFHGEPEEMSTLNAHGDVITGRQLWDTINARAAQMRQAGDTRPDGQRRFGALTEFILGDDTTLDIAGSTKPHPAGSPRLDPDTLARCQELARRRGEAVINVDLATVLGENNHPAHLDGYGPISAATARTFAANATWRRLVTNPINGELCHLDTTTYAPTNQIRTWVITRDQTCQHPGCRRPARRCQIDHRIPHGTPGGVTCICNLQPLCLMHHQMKTKGWYHVTIDPDGVSTWTSPHGFTTRRTRRETYTIPIANPPDDLHDIPEPTPPTNPTPTYPAPTYPDEPPPLPPEPPLDHHERTDLFDILDNSIGEFQTRAYNLLRAAQLIE